ncbi:hypothetical protein AUJ94_01545 [bacterium CG2_30_40_12]|uniref:Uncharacterized protein n=1 Tax=candidate division WWE3 bacterium CG23_combo_of_CG06-09_8_20_14_all_40_14 TaxID=1975095 RepID=A0A2G9XCU0_UNCKA|nr:MAG: hypothetical protein AUJ94_01545 [bacterium CG2_30_40_12]OJI08980.1 MAG: hypothetical protein BK003_01635 [bacterium CG09_39_24]PIP04782.1 MAG: hypothetical protein COX53_00645 [candidate division WWE3 bacterium CG23_combo_of_CG06-09_8_20_14_all_40_14]
MRKIPFWERRRAVGNSFLGNSANLSFQENLLNFRCLKSVPQTDTGGQIENIKVNGRTMVEELGKLTP